MKHGRNRRLTACLGVLALGVFLALANSPAWHDHAANKACHFCQFAQVTVVEAPLTALDAPLPSYAILDSSAATPAPAAPERLCADSRAPPTVLPPL